MGAGERRAVYLRRRVGLVAILGALVVLGIVMASGSGQTAEDVRLTSSGHRSSSGAADPPAAARAGTTAPSAPGPPALVVSAPSSPGVAWESFAVVHGRPAAWIAQRGGVTLMRFDQHLVRLDLHAGSSDGGVAGWRYGDRVSPSEIHDIIAAFNGGFKFSYPDVGFLSGNHVGLPLRAGLASIVTYVDGTTDIGAWQAGVPSPGLAVFSVLQNQHLLVDHGEVAVDASSCVIECWGQTIKELTSVARSALGITASGQLVWAAGQSLLPSELGGALVHAGVLRAAELDINPDWVAGYVYVHRPGGPEAVQATPHQIGVAGKFIEPYSRDFLTIVAR